MMVALTDDARSGLFTATIVLLIAALAMVSIAGLSLAAGLRRGDHVVAERYARRWAAHAIEERTLYELSAPDSWQSWQHVERREVWDGQIAVAVTAPTRRTDDAAQACLHRIGFTPRNGASLVLLTGVAIAGTFRVETASEYARTRDGAATLLQRKRIGGQEADLCRQRR